MSSNTCLVEAAWEVTLLHPCSAVVVVEWEAILLRPCSVVAEDSVDVVDADKARTPSTR